MVLLLLPLLGVFAWTFYRLAVQAVLENDLWWMIPMVHRAVDGKGAWEVLGYLLSPFPQKLGLPALKILLVLVGEGFGWQLPPILATAVLLHFLNGGLLYFFGRGLRLSRKVSLLASCLYLCFFPHFHAIVWPTAFQHLAAVATILALLTCVLKIERFEAEGPRTPTGWRIGFWMLAVAASVQRSGLIAPVCMTVHLLLDRNLQRRWERFGRWMPFFLFFPVYQMFSVSFFGDVKLSMAVVRWPLPFPVRFSILWIGAAAVLFLVRLALQPRKTAAGIWAGRALLFSAGAVVAYYLLRDKRQLLLPYNLAVPWVAAVSGFLYPVETAMRLNIAHPFHGIPSGISAVNLLLALGAVFLFWVLGARHKRSLWILAAWYAVTQLFLLFLGSSYPAVIPSRYFIYLSPLVALVFSYVLSYLCAVGVRGLGAPAFLRHGLAAGVVLGLACANLVAIPLASWRGRLTNSYFTYDYIRVARLIRDDPERKSGAITLSGVEPMPFDLRQWSWAGVDPKAHEVLRLIFRQTNGLDVKVWEKNADYRVEGFQLLDRQGREVDPFFRLLEEGRQKIRQADYANARLALRGALRHRPFFLRYVLPGSCRLEDVRWLTGETGLRTWFREMAEQWRPPAWEKIPDNPKQQYVEGLLSQELTDYALCLTRLSYVEHRLGNEEASVQWFRQIRLLEKDPDAVRTWLKPYVKDVSLEEFLRRVKDPMVWTDPIPWRKDDYGFGRFLIRFLFGVDVKSGPPQEGPP